MARAIWNGEIIAEADNALCEKVEGNIYFPPNAVKTQYLEKSDTHTVCPWKGTASYYSLTVDGTSNPDAAWYYPTPKDAAKQITGYVAFWRGVQVQE